MLVSFSVQGPDHTFGDRLSEVEAVLTEFTAGGEGQSGFDKRQPYDILSHNHRFGVGHLMVTNALSQQLEYECHDGQFRTILRTSQSLYVSRRKQGLNSSGTVTRSETTQMVESLFPFSSKDWIYTKFDWMTDLHPQMPQK